MRQQAAHGARLVGVGGTERASAHAGRGSQRWLRRGVSEGARQRRPICHVSGGSHLARRPARNPSRPDFDLGWCPCQQPCSTRPSDSSPGPSGRPAAAPSSSRRAARGASCRSRSRRSRSACSPTGSTSCSTRTPRAPPPSRSAVGTPTPWPPRSRTSSASTRWPWPGTWRATSSSSSATTRTPRRPRRRSVQTLRVVLEPPGGPGLRPTVRCGRVRRPPFLPVLRPAAGPDRSHLPACQRVPTLTSSTS